MIRLLQSGVNRTHHSYFLQQWSTEKLHLSTSGLLIFCTFFPVLYIGKNIINVSRLFQDTKKTQIFDIQPAVIFSFGKNSPRPFRIRRFKSSEKEDNLIWVVSLFPLRLFFYFLLLNWPILKVRGELFPQNLRQLWAECRKFEGFYIFTLEIFFNRFGF